ncbi:right-handed parallel beta-helix repeat-containing protein [Pedobacter insulae]|uniref:Right handed beta helix region n=1 Tax=Pedobacter insulae TaxID=414048 RepID=A0A1I2WH87_9SPHI|nr:right-handed parallel beta-helix repeat-containing protein [Pedobacter insulae]SFH00037.1 Right handed beta helix region [Pedobacter insulae]
MKTNLKFAALSAVFLAVACQKNQPQPVEGRNDNLGKGGGKTTMMVGTTYYVDNVGGNDSNAGTSTGSAWKNISKVNSFVFSPGDQILFKRGGAWTRTLRPQGEGISGSPIVIDAYGTGAKPIINGGGARDEGPDGLINTSDDILDGGATILLKNQSYWSINNIEVTNISSTQGNRQGIKIVVEDVPGSSTDEIVQGITIKGVTVRDVFGQYSFDTGKDTGGISLFFYRAPGSASSALVDARFQDIRIEECEVRDMNRGGIFSGCSDNLSADTHFDPNDYPISNLVIRRNIVDNCTGDGIVVRFAKAPLIESNLATNNHSGNESLVQHGVAIWCRSTKDAVFQFNEVYGTQAVSSDGMAFDADLRAVDTKFQYNYSHDNLGGFMLLIRSSENTTVRYNISQRDGRSNAVNRIFHFSKYPTSFSLPGDAQIYNNSVYVYDNTATTSTESVALSNFADNRTKFSNNIFYNQAGGIVKRPEDSSIWEYNHFYNYTNVPSSPTGIYGEGTGVNTNTTGNPLLSNAGSGGNLTGIGTKNQDGSSSLGTQVDGYKITSYASPAYQKGRLISNNGAKDFYGLTVSSSARPNKGAHNGCLGCN